MKINIIGHGYDKHEALLQKKISERIANNEKNSIAIELLVDDVIGAEESYCITFENETWKITGSDEIGLYHGIGKFLHTAKWSEDFFEPNPPKGVKEPECSFRAMYYSVHFYNWYHMCSIEELKEYTEEMLLWGYNAIICIIPLLNLNSCDEPGFFATVEEGKKYFWNVQGNRYEDRYYYQSESRA